MQSADRAGVEDAGDDDGQDGAGLSAGHRALQPRREGAPGHQPGGAAAGEGVRHPGGVHQDHTRERAGQVRQAAAPTAR